MPQHVVFDKPYKFVPPVHGNFWPRLLMRFAQRHLRLHWGITHVQVRGAEHLQQSMAQGHSVLLTPNHCRPCDPLVMADLARQLKQPFYIMASAHLFMGKAWMRFLLRRMGAFSVYREGLDKAAVDMAIDVLAQAKRPLIIFPEGVISRTNDRLNSLMEGASVIARSAAKRRAKGEPAGKVVVHPIAIRYVFDGDIEQTIEPVLTEIETRLSWLPQKGQPLLERIHQVGRALLCLKEIEYLGEPQTGDIEDRLRQLINSILAPLENKWTGSEHTGSVVSRVKRLRAAILPDMVTGEADEAERARRWHDLSKLHYAQQMSYYSVHYTAPGAPPEHLLETIERFEEDLTDQARIHHPMHAVVQIGEAMEVSPKRERGTTGDPLMQQVEHQLCSLLGLPEPAAQAPAPVPVNEQKD